MNSFQDDRFLALACASLIAFAGCSRAPSAPTEGGDAGDTNSSDAETDAGHDTRRDAEPLDSGADLIVVQDASQIVSGHRFSCVQDPNGVRCWGTDSHGTLDVPNDVRDAKYLATFWGNVCAIKRDDQLRCWGYEGPDVTINAAPPGTVSDLDVGRHHACAVETGGDVICWGADIAAVKSLDAIPDGTRVAVGNNFSCAISGQSQVLCWGFNNGGQIGDGTSDGEEHPPTAVSFGGGNGTFTDIAAGDLFACAIRDGELWCWGFNSGFQIPWSQNAYNAPVRYGARTDFENVEISSRSACASSTDGELVCWGWNDNGQVGAGSAAPSDVVDIEIPTVQNLRAGAQSFCAITDDGPYCWGANAFGETDPTGSTLSIAAIRHPVVQSPVDVNAGRNHVCAVEEGGVVCWGANNDRAGSGPSEIAQDARPTLPATFTPEKISAGDGHTCVIGDENGRAAYCWGSDRQGQSASPPNADVVEQPFLYDVDADYQEIAAGSSHTCAVTGKTVSCWGGNFWSQLGSIDLNQTMVENVSIVDLVDVDVSASGATCVKNDSDALTCFGRNASGEALVDPLLSSQLPFDSSVTMLADVSEFCFGESHGCAALNTGEVVCWGTNLFGEGGRFDTNPSFVASNVKLQNGGDLINVVAIACGAHHTCATDSDGKNWCWGDNSYGQLGEVVPRVPINDSPSFPPTSVSPVAVQLAQQWEALTLGARFTCGKSGEGISCWGDSLFNELGGGVTGTLTPKRIGSIP